MTSAISRERWQHIKHVVNEALEADAEARTQLLQQSCAEDFALRIGAEALLSVTRKLPEQPLAPDEWQRIEQLFQAALELDANQRAAYLNEACQGDENLRLEVESLLIYQNAAGGLIQGAVYEAADLLPHHEKARFTPGTTLNKRYRIIGLLGKGGMGEVYRADDLTLNQPVALKFLTEKLARDKAMLARFRSEVAMAHCVTHPNVCRVHDIGEVITSAGVLPFLSMEYVDGEDLSSLLRRIGRLPSDKAVEIAQQLCEGLAAAHEAGVLHRDLKPANVMIDGKGRVRITDFGLAGFAEQFTGSEIIAGTPAYMSPEQFAGKEVTTKSDIYALGLVLYEVFTGKRVFEAGSLDELRRMHESSAPTNPSSWVKDLDPLVERVILRCLEKDPGRRLASAKQVADALPGGDPLAAALAMGETPSPEMVAAAPLAGTLRPAIAIACLIAVLLGLVLIILLAGRDHMTRFGPLEKSPEVLSERANEIAKRLGYTEPPVDKVYGFNQDDQYLQYVLEHNATPARWDKVKAGEPAGAYFWYRQGPRHLVPYNFFLVSLDDPPALISGMVNITLDPRGRLRSFQAVPPQVDEVTGAAPAPDWSLLFAEAGLDMTKFTPTASNWLPPVNSDSRAAWEGVFPQQPQLPLRIEAAAYRGRPVYFQTIAPWDKPTRQAAGQPNVSGLPIVILLLLMLTAGALLARQNLRLGRGDRKGAFRLALYMFSLRMLIYIFFAHHVPTAAELPLFWQALVYSVFFGGISWLLYLAIEPYVRRRWPHRIVAWSRLLAGQFRDPLVGRDLLIGGVAAVGLVLFVLATTQTLRSFGVPAGMPGYMEWSALDGMRGLIGVFLAWLRTVINLGLCLMFLLLLLSRLLRKEWLAFGLAWLVFAFMFAMVGGTREMEGLVFVALFAACWIALLARFGLLATVTFVVCCLSLAVLPLTSDFSAWYAQGTFFTVGIVVAICGYGFYTSLGGQKVFSGKLMEE